MSAALLLCLLCAPVLGQTPMARDPEYQALLARQKKEGEAYQAAEAKESEVFSKGLAGKEKTELLSEVRTFKTEQYAKNCAFRDEQYDELSAFVEDYPVSEAMRARMLKRLEGNYREMKAFFKRKHEENMAFLDGLAADEALQGKALMDKLQAFFQAQKSDAKSYMKKKRGGRAGQPKR